MDEDLTQKLIQKAHHFLRFRPRSIREMRDYLNKVARKYKLVLTSDISNTIIDELKKLQLLDDHKFVSWWVGERNYFRPKGRRALIGELLEKGIQRDLIDNYFSENPQDEVGLAKKAIAISKKRIVNREEQAKTSQFLLRRGFMWDTIKRAFEEMKKKE